MRKELIFKTEVLPQDIPVLFTNRSLYFYNSKELRYIINNDEYTQIENKVTVPLEFSTLKNNGKKRAIQLIHPIAQLQVALFLTKYHRQITIQCKKSNFSIRKPLRLNQPTIDLQKSTAKRISNKISSYYDVFDKKISTDEVVEEYYNYFVYGRFSRLREAYQSPLFNRHSMQFNFHVKLDISNFFPSIYTHSIAWSIFGDKALGKLHRNKKQTFANKADKLMSNLNYGETNGIVVGAEFSRVIAEVLMANVDRNLYASISSKYSREDYKIYRYIDDYFIFCRNEQVYNDIEVELKKILSTYNLKLNESKTKVLTQPYTFNDYSITKLRREFDLLRIKIATFGYTSHDILDFTNTIFGLCVEYEESSSRLVKYFLKTVLSEVNKFILLPAFSEQNIIESVTKIFFIHPSEENLVILLAIFSKIQRVCNQLQITIDSQDINDKSIKVSIEKFEIDNIPNIYENKTYTYAHFYNKSVGVEDLIFSKCLAILNSNSLNIVDTYEVISFLKSNRNNIPSQLLCEYIEESNYDYFTLTAIAYYVLDNENNAIRKGYKTVEIILMKTIDAWIETTSTGVDKDPIERADYFYIVNDFSKYPGFSSTYSSKITGILKREISRNADTDKTISKMYNQITEKSYFKWEIEGHDYIERLIKKTIINSGSSVFSY